MKGIEAEGVVLDLSRDVYTVRVEIAGREQIVRACLSARVRFAGVRVVAGDRVKVDVSAHDTTKGRITWRH